MNGHYYIFAVMGDVRRLVDMADNGDLIFIPECHIETIKTKWGETQYKNWNTKKLVTRWNPQRVTSFLEDNGFTVERG